LNTDLTIEVLAQIPNIVHAFQFNQKREGVCLSFCLVGWNLYTIIIGWLMATNFAQNPYKIFLIKQHL
jgi:hypothetical protein